MSNTQERLVKFIDVNTIQYATDSTWFKTVFNYVTKRHEPVAKTREEVLAEGYKPLLEGSKTTEGDYQTIIYRDSLEGVYKDEVATWFTPEDEAAIQATYDALYLPRDVVLQALLFASIARPDITQGQLITKDVLRQQIMLKPVDPTFDEVARNLSLIALEDMQEWKRDDTFVNGTLQSIGFAKQAINKFFETRQVEDLIKDWVVPVGM